jgi:hypothetical protein
MIAKKTALNKSAFIRSQPAAMSTAEVIASGKAQGLKISSSLVYMVRGRAGAKAPKKAAAKNVAAIVAPKPIESKAAFVRSRSHLSPKEIVEDAKGAGLKLDVGYVYNVRGTAKASAKTKVMRQAARTVRTAGAVARPISTSSKAEDLLKALGAELGLGRAIEILAGERARVRAVLGAS